MTRVWPRPFAGTNAVAYLALFVAGLALSGSARATEETASADTATAACTAKRPVVLFNRWQEDWSVLADKCVPRQPLDSLKYIPLGGDPHSYLSLGANLRERL
ncbi:alginate export family protein, partial [Paraburkholderia sp. CNPSo 3157]|nr:alginate export family protein [Paraburkholderia franconis]